MPVQRHPIHAEDKVEPVATGANPIDQARKYLKPEREIKIVRGTRFTDLTRRKLDLFNDGNVLPAPSFVL